MTEDIESSKEPSPAEIRYAIARIGGRDPRFRDLVPDGHSLQSAIDAGLVKPTQARERVNRIIQLGTVELQISDLIECALGQIERSQFDGRLRALKARFGVYGDPVTQEEAGGIYGVRKQAFQQLESKVTTALRDAWIPSLERSARALAREAPVAPPIGAMLSRAGLAESSMTTQRFLRLAKLVNLDLNQFSDVTLIDEDGWIVTDTGFSPKATLRVARKHSAKFGMTTVEHIYDQIIADKTGPAPTFNKNDVLRVLQNSNVISWSDHWLWVEDGSDNFQTNSLTNSLRRMLAVTPSMSFKELHEGFAARTNRVKRRIVPPPDAIRGFANCNPRFNVNGDTITSTEVLDYRTVLSQSGIVMVENLRKSPNNALDWVTFGRMCVDAGLNPTTIRNARHEEYLHNIAHDVWTLRGNTLTERTIKDIQQTAHVRRRTERKPRRACLHLPDGKIRLVADVDYSSYISGTFSFPSTLPEDFEGGKFAASVGGTPTGYLNVNVTTKLVLGWEPSLQRLAVRPPHGTITAVLDLAHRIADVVAGEPDGVAEATTVERIVVEAVPDTVITNERAEFLRAASRTAEQKEAALTTRFRGYLEHSHARRVERYKISAPSGTLFTDTADTTAGVLYEAKAHADRMSVRLALGQILDYGRFVQDALLAILLPEAPPADLVELLKSHNVGCVVEVRPGEFNDMTGLGRCP